MVEACPLRLNAVRLAQNRATMGVIPAAQYERAQVVREELEKESPDYRAVCMSLLEIIGRL